MVIHENSRAVKFEHSLNSEITNRTPEIDLLPEAPDKNWRRGHLTNTVLLADV
jgi:hypothetical protein